MKVQYLSSAGVLVEHQGVRVLCDPWLTDGIYYGSWYHYPTLKFSPTDFTAVDYIYISHIHPDHLDVATLKQFPKDIPVLIHNYEEKFVLGLLSRAIGFTNIREVSHREEVTLAPDFKMEILAADNCNPQLCGKFFGCLMVAPFNRSTQIDSLAVFNGGGKTVVNTNDCPYLLARPVCDYIKEKYRNIDFLMVGYSGAGPYPQCFDNLDDAGKAKAAAAKQQQFLGMATMYLRHLAPQHFMPFAGQYTLGGRLAGLNQYRGVAELSELPQTLLPLLKQHAVASQMVLLNSGEWFDVDTQQATAEFTPVDAIAREKYIQEQLATRLFSYEELPAISPEELFAKVEQAQSKLLHRQKIHNYHSSWHVYLDTGQDVLFDVPFDGTAVTKRTQGQEIEPYVRVQLDPRLLNQILERRAHWNNAEVGSHLRFFRQPDEYERAIYYLMCFLHLPAN